MRAAEAREAEAERAVADERRRIAREMHDVVAHSVSMMVVQAGGARRILERDPARAVAAAELIERTGRDALAEMRALLGVLHADEHSEYAPQPTLRELEALVERARSAGVPVTLELSGERRELPAGLDLAAYRVVQEALTNVVKHSGGAPTTVSVHYRADAVEVWIADRGSGRPDTAARQRRPRPRRHARARPDVRRRAARRAPARRRLRGARRVPARGRGSGGAHGRSAGMTTGPGPDRRRPGARARRLQDDPRRRGRPRRDRRGGRRPRGGRARAALEARRRADGHPHAAARRHRGDAARRRARRPRRPCAC